MKRLVFAVITTLILCALTILNIPRETLTTTIGTSSNSTIEKTTIQEEITTTKVNSIKKKKSRSNDLKIGKYKITHYGSDCKGCSGITASGYNVKDTIYYNDSTYGFVRIVAMKNISLYSIIKINYKGSELIAIVLDRGVGTGIIDLLVENEKQANKLGITYSNIEILRSGK